MAWQASEKRWPELPKLVIEVAPGGPLIPRQYNPNVPYTPDEIAEETYESYKAGASIVHFHSKTKEGTPSQDPELFKEYVTKIRKKCPDIIVNASFSGATDSGRETDKIETRIDPTMKLGKEYAPEMVVLFCGTLNMGGSKIYKNTHDYIVAAAKYYEAHGVKPLLTCPNMRILQDTKELLIEPGIVKKPYTYMYLIGGSNSYPGTPEHLRLAISMLPPGSVWQVEVCGRSWLQISTLAILMGGHLKVGSHSCLYMYPHKDELIKHSADTVRKVANIARELGREIASPNETRAIYGIKPK